MPSYQIQFTRRANQDVADILNWLFFRSPQGAQRWLDEFERVQTRLSNSPLKCGLAEEAESFSEPVRQVLFRTRRGNTYRALYVVREELVSRLCVRGPGQPPVTPSELRL